MRSIGQEGRRLIHTCPEKARGAAHDSTLARAARREGMQPLDLTGRLLYKYLGWLFLITGPSSCRAHSKTDPHVEECTATTTLEYEQ